MNPRADWVFLAPVKHISSHQVFVFSFFRILNAKHSHYLPHHNFLKIIKQIFKVEFIIKMTESKFINIIISNWKNMEILCINRW